MCHFPFLCNSLWNLAMSECKVYHQFFCFVFCEFLASTSLHIHNCNYTFFSFSFIFYVVKILEHSIGLFLFEIKSVWFIKTDEMQVKASYWKLQKLWDPEALHTSQTLFKWSNACIAPHAARSLLIHSSLTRVYGSNFLALMSWSWGQLL